MKYDGEVLKKIDQYLTEEGQWQLKHLLLRPFLWIKPH
jgi:hypothetical protein